MISECRDLRVTGGILPLRVGFRRTVNADARSERCREDHLSQMAGQHMRGRPVPHFHLADLRLCVEPQRDSAEELRRYD
jgi:hypothetical protein